MPLTTVGSGRVAEPPPADSAPVGLAALAEARRVAAGCGRPLQGVNDAALAAGLARLRLAVARAAAGR